MNAETWAIVGTILGTILFLIVPGVAYTYYVLDDWIGSRDRYPDVRRHIYLSSLQDSEIWSERAAQGSPGP
jgi:hypothetical protein